MKYDLRQDPNEEHKGDFLAWLFDTTVADLRRSRSEPERIRSAIFLYLHRAYEARIDPEEVVELLGVSDPSILSSAGYTGQAEELAMHFYEELDPTVADTYGF